MKCYFFLRESYDEYDELEDIVAKTYAYTTDIELAYIFKKTRNMKLFIIYKANITKTEFRKVQHDIAGFELMKLPIYRKPNGKYNKYSNCMDTKLVVTKHESIKTKAHALEKISKLSWDFEDNKSFLLLKKDYIFALNDIYYDRSVNYQIEELISENKILGDYLNCFIELYKWTLKG